MLPKDNIEHIRALGDTLNDIGIVERDTKDSGFIPQDNYCSTTLPKRPTQFIERIGQVNTVLDDSIESVATIGTI